MDPYYRVPIRTKIIRSLLRPFFRALFYILGPIEITGRDNIPKSDAYIIAINHISLFEAPLLVAFWPVAPEAMGAIEIWQRKGQSLLVRLYGGIPVHRSEYDRKAIDFALAILKSGRPLLIAPEGGRSHKPGLRKALPGVAYIIDKAGVPVVPVGIVGSTDDYLEKALHFKRPKLSMHIGKPITLPPIAGSNLQRKLSRQKNADLIMVQIAALLPQDYQGVYASQSSLTE